MPRALQLENPLVLAYTTGVPSIPTSQLIQPQPDSLYLMSWFVRTGSSLDPEYVLRLQNIVEGGPDITVDLNALFPSLNIISWEELGLALDNVEPRTQWGGQAALTRGANVTSSVVTVSSMDMRTFLVRVE